MNFKSGRGPTTTWPARVLHSPPAWKRPGTVQSPRNAISLRLWRSARQEVRTSETCSLPSLPRLLLLTMAAVAVERAVAEAVAKARAREEALRQAVARAAKTVAKVSDSLAVQLKPRTADLFVSATTTQRSIARRPDAPSFIVAASVSAAILCLDALAMLLGLPQRPRAVALGCEGGQGRPLHLPPAPRFHRSLQPLHLTIRFSLLCHLPLQFQHRGNTVRFTFLQDQSVNRI